jgi:Uma2 family endonuclease
MSRAVVPAAPDPIDYPESDGQPMSDNTLQFQWIVVLADNLKALFRDRDDVFVSGNQFWYPVEGEREVKAAPDVHVVFGRPKGHRGSYKQWEEGGIPMTVVFEVLSPSNTTEEMAAKLDFYDEHGVEEYYIYDPQKNRLQGYRRGATTLVGLTALHGFTSPRLGIQFDLSGPELVVRYPDGPPFLLFEELEAIRLATAQRAEEEKQRADQENQRATQAEQRAAEEKQRATQAEQRADQAEQRAEQEKQRATLAEQRADQEKQRADQMAQRAARLAELTRKALQQQATPEELEELQRLLGSA